ncbi:MAG: TadE/TadG family type IV pilus assembly protein [Pseudomonadota bacterium]
MSPSSFLSAYMRKALLKTSVACRAFAKSTRGNIAIMFGLMAVPVFGMAGAAVDLSRAVTIRAQLGEALDATGLAVARATGLNESEAQTFAQTFFEGNYPPGAIGTTGTVSVQFVDNKVIVSNDAKVKTLMASIFGVTELTITAETEVIRETKGLEVVLVLDNTGSMNSSGKIGALRTAATELVNILTGSTSNPSSLKIGLVPFVTTVNVKSPGAYQSSWIDQNAQATYHGRNFIHVDSSGTPQPNTRVNHFDLFTSVGVDWKGCVEMRPEPYDTKDVPPTSADPDSRWVPYFWPDEPDCKNSGCNPSYVSSVPNEGEYHNRTFIRDKEYTKNSGTPRDWYEDFVDDAENATGSFATYLGDIGVNDVDNDEYRLRQAYVGRWTGSEYDGKLELNPSIDEIAVDGNTGTSGPNKSCPRPIVPLTTDKSLLLTEISKMAPHGGGGTNIAAGMAWGWRVLSPAEPYSQGASYTDDAFQKAMVVLTDGENWIWGGWNSHNRSNYSGWGYLKDERMGNGVDSKSTAQSEINNKVAELCNAIKAEDIRLYTITFKVNGSVKPLFKNCATDPELYYDSPSNENLREVFQAIAQDLSNLRISR